VSAPVTVAAPDFAARHFALKDHEGAATPRQQGHIASLRADMVEVENEDIAQPAVNAPEGAQRVPNQLHVAYLAGEQLVALLQAPRISSPR
jgi:hypothetical protein